MPIPPKILERLRYGKPVAAEIAATEPNMRVYLVVIPQVPDVYKDPEAYMYQGENVRRHILRDPSVITGYEIRLLKHDAKYADEAWSEDYDTILFDKTTRVKRLFVGREEEIEKAITPWLPDASYLKSPEDFDSSLVDSPIDAYGYLNRPEELPHLWQED